MQKGVAVKRTYLTPETEIIIMRSQDIITTSGGNDSSDLGGYDPSTDVPNSGWTGW